MEFRYKVNERPPLKETAAFGLQWLVLTVPLIIIFGRVAAGIDYPQEPALQLAYLQRLFLVSGLVLLAQLFFGHKMPLIVGPSTVLLIGIMANAGAATGEAIYSSLLAGGAVITLLSAFGLLSRVGTLFTKRVIVVVLLLIAFTMLPAIGRLLTAGPALSFGRLVFVGGLLAAMLVGQRFLPELLKSTIIFSALVAGSVAYYLLLPAARPPAAAIGHVFAGVGGLGLSWPTFQFDAGVFVSFLFCYLALVANDVGSIRTTAHLLQVDDSDARTKAGLFVTGLGNILAGFCGVVGPVDFSVSIGAIMLSGCASRYPMVPAAAGLVILAFAPGLVQAFSYIPQAVIGTLLFYMMSSQVAGAFGLIKDVQVADSLQAGLTIGVPVMLGTMVAFLPANVVAVIPPLLKPLLANGLVVGVTAVIFLEFVTGRGPGRA